MEQTQKKELFDKEPDSFIHISELEMAVRLTDDKRSFLVNTTNPFIMGGIIFTLLRQCLKNLDIIELQRFRESQEAKKLSDEISKKNHRNFFRRK